MLLASIRISLFKTFWYQYLLKGCYTIATTKDSDLCYSNTD